jgi:hypothetical protein
MVETTQLNQTSPEKAMNKAARLVELKSLQIKADAIRAELRIGAPGAILFQAHGDDLIIVEADGFGRAVTSIVEGNYPVDYCIKFERLFESEQEAEAAADAVATGKASPSAVLSAPVRCTTT